MQLKVYLKDVKIPVILYVEKFYYDNDSLVAVHTFGVRKFHINDIESFDVEEEIPELL